MQTGLEAVDNLVPPGTWAARADDWGPTCRENSNPIDGIQILKNQYTWLRGKPGLIYYFNVHLKAEGVLLKTP